MKRSSKIWLMTLSVIMMGLIASTVLWQMRTIYHFHTYHYLRNEIYVKTVYAHDLSWQFTLYRNIISKIQPTSIPSTQYELHSTHIAEDQIPLFSSFPKIHELLQKDISGIYISDFIDMDEYYNNYIHTDNRLENNYNGFIKYKICFLEKDEENNAVADNHIILLINDQLKLIRALSFPLKNGSTVGTVTDISNKFKDFKWQ